MGEPTTRDPGQEAGGVAVDEGPATPYTRSDQEPDWLSQPSGRSGRVRVRRSRPKLDFRPDIQGLRAVAVLLVVASHAGVPAMDGGYVGVDVFFVISGFLITGLLIREGKRGRGISLTDFYARRARRILPAASLVLIGTLVASVLFLGVVRAGEIGREAVWAAFFAINWKFVGDGTDYFASNLPPSPLQHFWSLAVEEQFYLVWPLLFGVTLTLFARRARKRRRALRKLQGVSRRQVKRPTRRKLLTPRRQVVLAGVVLLIGVGSFAYSVLATAAAPNAAYFSAFTRAWELAVGALIALLAPQLVKLPAALRTVLAWAGLVGIVASAVVLTEATPFPGSIAAWPVLATALVVLGGIGSPKGGTALLLGRAPMRWVGDRSYSLYLWHWPVLIIAAAYVGRDLEPLEAAVCVLLALLLTMATYSLVEYPIHKGRLRTTRYSSLALWPVSLGLVALMGLVAVDAAREVPFITGPGFEFQAVPQAPSGGGVLPTAPPTRGGNGPAPNRPTVPGSDAEVPPEGTVEFAVYEAVTAARSGEPVPEELNPPLGSLREDTWEQVTECAAPVGQTTSDLCGYGPADADFTMAIVGDSHAGMWVNALKSIAERENIRLVYLVKGGCSSADIVPEGSGQGNRQAGCREWRDWAIGQLTDLAPDLVILANRGNKNMLAPDGSVIRQETAEHDEAWADAIESSVRTLSETAGRVVVLGESPVLTKDPVNCLSAASASLQNCLTRVGDGTVDTAAADEAGAVAGGGEYVDTLPWFCWGGGCPMIVGGLLVYTDGQHLSLTYSASLATTLQAALGI